MICIIDNYIFTVYHQENEGFLRGSHKTQEQGNYRYAMHIPGVYIIKHMPTGSFYVGNTTEIGRRLSHHFGNLQSNRHDCSRLQELYNRSDYLDFAFKYTMIVDKDERFDLEEDILAKNIDNPLILNTVVNGRTWIHKKNENIVGPYREKLSEWASSRTGDKNPFYGKSHTEDTKKKMRVSKLGKENPSAHSAVVINGIYYKSQTHASQELGVNSSTISHRVKNDNPLFCNYYTPTDKNDIKIIDERFLFDPKEKGISTVYDIEGKIYFKTKDISEVYDIHQSSVSWRCKSKNIKYKNWKRII